MKDTINIGILGLGQVGSGTVALLQSNADEIARKVGARLAIRRVAVRDLAKKRAVEVDRALLTNRPADVIDDPSIDVMCELIGGVSPAREFVARALAAGKHIVTANKEMIAKEGHDLLEEAARRRLDFLFEGSVAGGIPIVQPMKNALAGNNIADIRAIVNGTTNYILTRMTREGAEFADVLREAQSLGYAEADPTSDVEGYDAQYKMAILSSIAYTSRVNVSDVYVEGITHITRRDIQRAGDLGYIIKLLGISQRIGADGMQVRVHPTLLPAGHPLASTNDVYNAVYVRGDAVGDLMFYGRGAGSAPTGSAVVGDLVDVARNILSGSTARVTCTCFERRTMVPIEEIATRYYLRVTISDVPRALAAVASVFGEHDISIDSVNHRPGGPGRVELVWLTYQTREAAMRSAIADIAALPTVVSVDNWLRVEE